MEIKSKMAATLDERQRWSSKGTFLQSPPMMEIKSKMAATLDERQRWSSKGTFLQSPPMNHQKIRPVDPGVGQKINGNQIQDGGCNSHERRS
jgi:hypothetical protein